MKILFLSKRRPQGRDLLTRPYGRFFYIPRILSERGHDVCLLLLSYQKEARSRTMQHGMTWITESVFPTGPLAYIRGAERLYPLPRTARVRHRYARGAVGSAAEGTLSVSDALRVFSIRSLVAAKITEMNKEIITTILKENRSNFLSTDFIF